MSSQDKLIIKGAREHNLKNIDVELPRNKLIVVSGLSGSGKSSLAFDTIFAEGQRRYVESLSSYARQFLGRMDKPDLDYIEGLSPAISIEQKTTHKNPRSTVGTVTEIYDYYRLLFARIGKPHCPECGREIQEQSTDQIINTIMDFPEGTKVQILAPVIHGKKGEHQKIITDAIKSSFLRARIDGLMVELDENIKLDKQKKHSIDLVVDRIKIRSDIRKRVADSVETALNYANGLLVVLRQLPKIENFDENPSEKAENQEQKEEELFFSQKNSCPDCGISIPELQPRLFSFNNPFGACPDCTGLGERMEFDENLVIPDKNLSIAEGAIQWFNIDSNWNRSRFEALAKKYDFSLETPINKLKSGVYNTIIHGSDETIKFVYTRSDGTGTSEFTQPWPGVMKELKRRYSETFSESQKESLERLMNRCVCES
ncbi:MAG: excinuclease ABC subunit UvrA, partial [Treponemataceae bacterium]|nr:excinuclease ABC subunit UvrA [Treponemataceae bacterium]